jgi:lysophospholipase L1-like esterase
VAKRKKNKGPIRPDERAAFPAPADQPPSELRPSVHVVASSEVALIVPDGARLVLPTPTPDLTSPGLRSLASSAAVLMLAIALTYAIPPLHRFRPWLPGEPIPVLRHFVAAEVTEVEGEPVLDDTTLDVLSAETPEPPPVARGAELVIAPEEYAERTRSIEDPAGAMRAFYAALARTAREPDEHDPSLERMTRVAHFGDSTIATDGITMTVRERLQLRFGEGGHGFVLTADAHLPYRHHMVRHGAEGSWSVQDLTHLTLSDGRYGLGGVQSRSVSGGTAFFSTLESEDATLGTAVSRFDVLFQRHPRGGHFRYRVDEGEWVEIDTHADAVEDAIEHIEVPEGHHRLSLRTAGHGESRFYGVVLERGTSGVVYDSLGVVGARAARMMGFDPAHLATQLEQRGTNLVILAFGGNDADDERSTADFEEVFRRVARLARDARPEASCLLFAPLDQAERDERGRVRTLAPVPRIVTAMRNAALAEGCAFFDTYEAMGGQGSMGRWARMGLASSDYRHATPSGYRVIGNLFYEALLEGFAGWIAEGEPGAGADSESGTGTDSESGTGTGASAGSGAP